MSLNNDEIHAFLKERGFTHLHHANTVATSLTFLKSGGILSREAVEKKGLFQTSQLSDNDDKVHGVWNDVFFDTKDLHGFFPRQNLYGPVLFKFNLDVILQKGIEISITKNNPMFWVKGIKEEDKYFNSIDDFKTNWDKYQLQRKMVTIRNQNDAIPFTFLENIILDDPNVTIWGNIVLLNESNFALKKVLEQVEELQKKFSIRAPHNCYCQTNYLNDYGALKLAKYFLPINHPNFNNS